MSAENETTTAQKRSRAAAAWSSRPALLLAIGILAVIGSLGGWVILSGDRSSPSPVLATEPPPSPAPPVPSGPPLTDGTTQEPAAPSTSTTASKSWGSPCGLTQPAGAQDLAIAPPAATWEYLGTTAYPVSSTAGPGARGDGFSYCFAPSPAGAVHAAFYAVAMGSAPDPAARSRWLAHVLAPDAPGRADIIKREASSGASSGSRIIPAGFHILEYRPGTPGGEPPSATVELALRVSTSAGTGYWSVVYSYRWVDGDWAQIVVDPDNPVGLTPLPDLAGFTVWGPSHG